jgi:hypothetical protein
MKLKNKKKNDNRIKKRLWFILIIALMILFGIAFKEFLQPAYYSMKSDCDPKAETPGYVKVGQFSVINNTPNIEIVSTTPERDAKITKHELCHQRQWEERRIFSCNHKDLVYLNELECYLVEKLA